MKKMKKIILLILVVAGIINSFNIQPVNAKTAPDTIKLKPKSAMYYFNGGTDYISGYNFYRKELSDGKLAYCISNISEAVPAGQTLSVKEAIDDNGLDYILKNGYPNKSFTGNEYKDYYITQAAIWKYFDETRGSNNWKNTSFTSTSSTMKAAVYNLVQAAKNANNVVNQEPSISLSVDSKTMMLSDDQKYFVSNPVKVELKSTKGTYTVNLVNAKEGTIVKNTNGEVKTTFNQGENFVVSVPNNGDLKGTVSLTVTAEGVTYKTYSYTVNNKKYQDIAPVEIFEVITNLTSSELMFSYEKEEPATKVKISKQDITTKEELPGATLILKDKDGKVIEEWVSTSDPHYIEGLKPGNYTLTEKIAPVGYILSEETIEFTLESDGAVKTVVMYNAKETKVTKVKISKQDITTKEELPGATLTIKDKDGKVVEEWVSTSDPHYIEGLKPGNYTLTEKIAPVGYILSEETIEFTLESDGTVKTVVMYNTKEEKTKVKISKQDITTKEELPGATLILKDKDGKVVEEWVSTSDPHYIEGLKPGNYTLTEKIAPVGYILSEETIEFTLESDGTVKTVVMYNAKETKVTKVKISKQDITSKEELPGATLTIKDTDGKVVEEWVSTNTPYYIEGLEPGKYTLTEKIAPEGYILSEETIEFTVKDNGEVTSVTMYNTRYTEVPITDLSVSKTTIIIASILIIMGTGLVVYYAKHEK